jgi:hypothetical protein
MSYFKEEFLPSRSRVFEKLFSHHPWLLKVRKFLIGDKVRFGVSFRTENNDHHYTLEEEADGTLEIFDGIEELDFKVFKKIPLNLVFYVDESYLKGWVEKEEKLLKRPLPYFLIYVLRTLFKGKRHRKKPP